LQRIRRAYNSKLANAVIKLSASFADEYAKKKAYSAENRTNLTDSYIHKIKDLERSIVELEYSVSEAKRIAEENLKKIDVNKNFLLCEFITSIGKIFIFVRINDSQFMVNINKCGDPINKSLDLQEI